MPEPRAAALVALRIAVAMALVAGVGALAHLPLGETPGHAVLRVALRTPHAQVEICRDRAPEELAALPVHMRQPRICETTAIDYRLRIEIDGRQLLDRSVSHRGVRRNRPLVVDERFDVAPGERRVAVRFEPRGALAPDVAAGLPAASFDATVELPTGRIRILALAADGTAFRLVD